jgi:FtsZ-binding cell division protein ZapB
MSGVKLERTLDQWRNCSAKAMATKLSTTAIAFAIADAKHDIEALANENDTLRAANQRLETELANLKEDRDQQYDMKVKARGQRDAVTASNQRLEGEVVRLREALQAIYDCDYQAPHDASDTVISDSKKHCIFRMRNLADVALRGNGGE